jgi:hypothetical protein
MKLDDENHKLTYQVGWQSGSIRLRSRKDMSFVEKLEDALLRSSLMRMPNPSLDTFAILLSAISWGAIGFSLIVIWMLTHVSLR